MADDGSRITDQMRAVVGVQSPPETVEIERGAIRAFARSTGQTDPVYYDVEAARAAGYPDIPSPPGFLGRYIFVPGKTDGTFSAPLSVPGFPAGGLVHLLHGSTRIRTYRRLFAGERLSVTSQITVVSERQGRIGHMVMADSAATFRDQSGAVVAEKYDTEIHY